MSKGLDVGAALPDFELDDDEGTRHRLPELQGTDFMVLQLGRGEHCPRERQQHRELVRFHQWCAVAFTQLVTMLPNDAHETNKLKITTGAYRTFLCDEQFEVQRTLDIKEYTDPHHPATVPHTLVLGPGLEIEKDLRRILVLGPALHPPAVGRHSGHDPAAQGGLRPDASGGPCALGERAADRVGHAVIGQTR